MRVTDRDAVALPARLLYDDGNRMIVPSLSRTEALAMPRVPESELKY